MPTFAHEEPDFLVYQAQSRKADDLKTAAESVLNGGRVTASGDKVIIYGTKSQRDAVLKLFAQLDHALRNFAVRFRIAKRGNTSRNASAVQADAHGPSGYVEMKSGELAGRGGGTAGVVTQHGGVSASAESASASGDSTSDEEVVVMEGGTGRLYSGNSVFPQTVSVEVNSIGRNAGARLVIREQDPNALGEQAIVSEINVPFGEWRSLGGVSSATLSRNHEIVGGATRSQISTDGVQVRVDLEK